MIVKSILIYEKKVHVGVQIYDDDTNNKNRVSILFLDELQLIPSSTALLQPYAFNDKADRLLTS